MSSIDYRYRKIDPDFLDAQWEKGFPVFGEVHGRAGKLVNFDKVAEYSPATHGEVLELINAKKEESFYIHETDLIRYYNEVVFNNLEAGLEKNQPDIEKIKIIYKVCRGILNECFNKIPSNGILALLGKLAEPFEHFLASGNFIFTQLFSITEKDGHLYNHYANSGLYCAYLGNALDLTSKEIQSLALGGMVANIGMKAVPKELQKKEGKLTDEEFKVIRKHPAAGKKILSEMNIFSNEIINMAAEHHEKFNGEGYPFGLSGEEISPSGRICAIMDVFDAMTCQRTHRNPLSPVESLKVMKSEASISFDSKFFNEFTKTLTSRK